MITTLRQSSSAGAHIDLSSVSFQCDMTKISNCGLRHPMKLTFATRVRMDVKAFPSRPSVPLLITNSQRRNSILFMTAMKYQWITSSENADATLKLFPMVLMFFLVTQVRNCEDESLILYYLHRITFLLCCDMVHNHGRSKEPGAEL
ncbi:hypothetical protein T07_9634 [Trichinella nelsoni]|uniref:Uncharacterized protein n=1 Tax=Trichinella nelsoni TaxID=6336 RepID=A0A0V0SBE9_9BILA|nr:hypothetical protein T07_9634 [Trichinella nelsoni]